MFFEPGTAEFWYGDRNSDWNYDALGGVVPFGIDANFGHVQPNGAYHYRIHSPVVLIEFDHQRPIGLGRSGEATCQHIHAVIRTPNGNDYGKDLLRQHLEKHPH